MTDKAKPPQPMAFKNLAELKRYIKLGTEFKATRHKYHPDIVGLTRVVTYDEALCIIGEYVNITGGDESEDEDEGMGMRL